MDYRYRCVDVWTPRNIIRFDRLPPLPVVAAEPRGSARLRGVAEKPAKPAQPAAPRFDESHWNRVLDAVLLALKPFEQAYQAVREAVLPLVDLELCHDPGR